MRQKDKRVIKRSEQWAVQILVIKVTVIYLESRTWGEPVSP